MLEKLSSTSVIVLGELCHLLADVAANSTSTKMSPDNLAIVFTPNILLNPNGATDYADFTLACGVVQLLIEQHTRIFHNYVGAHNASSETNTLDVLAANQPQKSAPKRTSRVVDDAPAIEFPEVPSSPKKQQAPVMPPRRQPSGDKVAKAEKKSDATNKTCSACQVN